MRYPPAHGGKLQLPVATPPPTHVTPPLEGGGSVHECMRVLVASPHVTIQLLHGDHVLQPPLTCGGVKFILIMMVTGKLCSGVLKKTISFIIGK